MTTIRMQARSHASEGNGQSETAEISGKLVSITWDMLFVPVHVNLLFL